VIENKLQSGVPLAPHTSFRIGGPARYYTEPENLPDFKDAVAWALDRKIDFFILGGGSNVLFHDDGYDGLVINTMKLSGLAVEGEQVSAECGVRVDELVDACARHSLTGVEFAAGLPGTVGGALYMNARAYEGSFSAVAEQVHALGIEGHGLEERVLRKKDLGFGYKKSVFQGGRSFVLKVLFHLEKGPELPIRAKTEENRRKRIDMGQYIFPNAGCIFKNNYEIGVPTGKIIEELGFKGKKIGGAEVYERHANFIINRGNASAEDVYSLIRAIEVEMEDKRGIKLEREILLLGDWKGREKV